MGKYRLWITKLLTVIAFTAFVLAGLWLWDRNQNRHDQKMMSGVIYDLLRAYDETGDPDAVICPYIGSIKTKI